MLFFMYIITIRNNVLNLLNLFIFNLKLGLFQKAIMQSGCMFNPWAFNENHRESAFKLAKHLGCEKDNPQEVVQYLLNVPAIDIVKFTKIEVMMH